MTPLVKWLRNRAEKWLGQHYEGPRAPDRLREEAIAFANMHPLATRAEWTEFAGRFAGQCYEAGYLRGLEWAERDPDAFDASLPPDMIADQMDPDWRWRPAIELEMPEETVPVTVSDAEATRQQMAAVRKGSAR